MLKSISGWFESVQKNPKRALPLVVGIAAFVVVFAAAPSNRDFFQFTVIGIAEGAIFAVAASGLVLTYATTGVFNFAHGAVGMMSGFVYYSLSVKAGLPVPIALFLVLFVFAPLVGLLIETVMRRFKNAPATTTIVITVALTIFLIGLAQRLYPPDQVATLPKLFGERTIDIGSATITWDQAAFFVVAILVAVALRALLFTSRIGTAMRAVVDNPTLAALNGAPPVTVARYSWMLGSVLAALAGVLLAPGVGLDPINLTFFVASAYGAAVFGRLRSLPLTFVGALLLGLAKNYALLELPQTQVWSKVRVSIPGLFLFGALLVLPEAKLTVGRLVGRRSPAVPKLRSSLIRSAGFVGFVAALANFGPEDQLADMTRGLIFAVLLLSLVVLTGFSGQVSLSQYVFLAIGSWAMGKTFGGDSIFGMLIAGFAAVPLGVIIAFPAMRLQGLYLALVTFGFALVSKELILQQPSIYGKNAVNVGRLDLFGIDFSSNEAFMVLCAIVFVALGIGVLALKRGPYGRRLAAMGDSQAACATLGLDIRRTKLTVFALSAFIAGVAGALFGGLNGVATELQFEPINNIVLFLFAVVGGITTVTGALFGGALFALLPYVQSKYEDYAGLVFAAVAIAAIALGRQPNGLAGMVYERLGSRGRAGVERDAPAEGTPIGEEAAVGASA